MNKRTRYSPEVRERAVRMVFEHRPDYGSQWAAMASIAAKNGRFKGGDDCKREFWEISLGSPK